MSHILNTAADWNSARNVIARHGPDGQEGVALRAPLAAVWTVFTCGVIFARLR